MAAWLTKGFMVIQQNAKGGEVRIVRTCRSEDEANIAAENANTERRTDFGLNPRFAVLSFKAVAVWENGWPTLRAEGP